MRPIDLKKTDEPLEESITALIAGTAWGQQNPSAVAALGPLIGGAYEELATTRALLDTRLIMLLSLIFTTDKRATLKAMGLDLDEIVKAGPKGTLDMIRKLGL